MDAKGTFSRYAHAEQLGAEIFSVAFLTHQSTRLSPQFVRDALQWALAGWQVAMFAARNQGRPLSDEAFTAAIADLHAALLRQAQNLERETGATLLSPALRQIADRPITDHVEDLHARN